MTHQWQGTSKDQSRESRRANAADREPKREGQQALTSIRAAYTLAATNEAEEPELDTLMVKHFIQTLAEISVSVASRRLSRQEPNR